MNVSEVVMYHGGNGRWLMVHDGRATQADSENGQLPFLRGLNHCVWHRLINGGLVTDSLGRPKSNHGQYLVDSWYIDWWSQDGKELMIVNSFQSVKFIT